MSILCHIALRMVLQFKTPEAALEAGRKWSKIFCTNKSQRDGEDFFKRGLMATFLLRCLQKCEFFGRRVTESAEPTEMELEVGSLLFVYLQSLQFNAHEIYETVTSGHKFEVRFWKAVKILNFRKNFKIFNYLLKFKNFENPLKFKLSNFQKSVKIQKFQKSVKIQKFPKSVKIQKFPKSVKI